MKRTVWVLLLLLVAGGASGAVATKPKKPVSCPKATKKAVAHKAHRRPVHRGHASYPRRNLAVAHPSHSRAINARGVSYDPDFNVEVYLKNGKISPEQYRVYRQMREAGTAPRPATIHEPVWNQWVDRAGGLHTFSNAPDGKFHPVGEELQVEIYGTLILRSTCKNLIIGTQPAKPALPEKPVKICVYVPIVKVVDEGSKKGFEFIFKRKQEGGFATVAKEVSDEDGNASHEITEPGDYRLLETEREGYKLKSPESGYYEFTVAPGQTGKIGPFRFCNEKVKPKPKDVCVTLRICKSVEGGSPQGYHFKLMTDLGEEVTTLVSDADGRAKYELREAGHYRLKEVDLPADVEVVEPKGGEYSFDISPEMDMVVKEFRNRVCKPAPTFEATPERPLPLPELPGRVSGYFPGRPSREVRTEQVGAIGAFSQRTINRRNTRVITRRPPPGKPPIPPGHIPHGGGKTGGTPGDGNGPGGGGKPGD